MSRRYSTVEARKRFAELLDRAQHGERVIIERRGVQFQLLAAEPAARGRTRRKLIVEADEAVLDGQWSWTPGDGTFDFEPRRDDVDKQ
jgi:prevent-host-death family protein